MKNGFLRSMQSSKNPENGFILQESSTTGVRTDGDFTKKDAAGAQGILSRQDFDFDRNLIDFDRMLDVKRHGLLAPS